MSKNILVKDHQDYWLLAIEGGIVIRCVFDYGCVLEITWKDISITIRIEGDILFTSGGETKTLLGDAHISLAYILAVLEQRIDFVKIFNDGKLTLTFSNDITLNILPNDSYETWQITSDNGLRIVCMPGGELAIWTP
jgi:hypothetical protein